MRLIRGLTLFFFALALCSQASAGIRPSFSLESCSWRATHIVVATEGKKIDGDFQVLESWRGDLLPGETVKIPELASFNSLKARYINGWGSEKERGGQPTYVTGDRMVLFLRDAEQAKVSSEDEEESEEAVKPNAGPSRWKSANAMGNEMDVSVVWMEQGDAYGFLQRVNPGPSLLYRLGITETEMRQSVLEILNTRDALNQALAIPNLTKRAEALQPFVKDSLYSARATTFAELGKCGKAALPILRRMLEDVSLAETHADVIGALAQAGGQSVADELTVLLGRELEFWKQIGPALQAGWWNGTGFNSLEKVEPLRNRYMVAYQTLQALKKMQYRECEKTVTEFRDFWRSLSQLEDKSGLDQMSEACDEILQSLHQSANKDKSQL